MDAAAEDFSVLGPVRVSARGDMAMTFRQDGQVRIYDSTGRQLAAFGRRGGGPGEFRGFQVEGWVADTLRVYDYELKRHTFVSRNGSIVRTTLLPAAFAPDRRAATLGVLASSFTPQGMRPDGTMLGLAMAASSDGTPQLAVVEATPAGAARVVRHIPAGDQQWDAAFAFRPQVSISPDAQFFVELKVDGMTQDGGTFTLSVFGADGAPMFASSFPYVGEPIPNRVSDSVLAVGSIDNVDRVRRSIDRARIPPVYAPVEGVGIGRDGTIWIALRDRARERQLLLVRPDGTASDSVTVPNGSSYVADVAADRLWIRELDSNGLTSLVRYRLAGVR